MSRGRLLGRAPQHDIVMALRLLTDLPSGPRYTAFDRPGQLYRLALGAQQYALAPADVSTYLTGLADAAHALTRTTKDTPSEQTAHTLAGLAARAAARDLPTAARLAPYLQGVQHAVEALEQAPPRQRRTYARTYEQAALQALPRTPKGTP